MNKKYVQEAPILPMLQSRYAKTFIEKIKITTRLRLRSLDGDIVNDNSWVLANARCFFRNSDAWKVCSQSECNIKFLSKKISTHLKIYK